MPVVNPRGDIVHGLNGVGVFLNNVQIATGDKPCWYDSQTIVYQHIEGLEKYLAFYKLGSPPEITKAHAEGADVLFASGYGHWVARLQTLGIFASDGWTLPAPTAQLLDMGADGAIAYMDASGVHVRETTGDVWLLTNRTGTIYVKLLGQQRAIWVESGAIKTKGLPSVKVMPEKFSILMRWLWVVGGGCCTGQPPQGLSCIHGIRSTGIRWGIMGAIISPC